jgi:KaiC/GvpD/RAD55 family RecA-like ATPase
VGSTPPEHLPSELEAFLTGTPPQSLTVRGAPGVGKTTLALTVLAAFQGERIFVSTRVPVDAFRRQFPWVERRTSAPIEFIELVRFRAQPPTNIDSVDYLRQTLQARASDLVDVSQVLNLPADLAKRLGVDPPRFPRLIVIDSWEAWVENILGSSAIRLDAPTTRWELERSMLDRLLSTGSSVAMVVEREERSRFDYITDGAVLLTATEVDGREERWLEITKLRGVRIRSRSYPYTLEGARFRAIQRPMAWTVGPAHSQPDPASDAGSLWSGASAFDEHFGRVPTLGPLLIEADAETPVRTLWRLVAPIIESALKGGGRVVVGLPDTLGPREVWPTLSGIGALPHLTNSLRVIVPVGAALPRDAPRDLFVYADAVDGIPNSGANTAPTPGTEPPRPEGVEPFDVVGFLRVGFVSGPRNLVVLFPSTTIDLGPSRGPDPLLLLPSQARRRGAEFSTVVVMRTDDPYLNEGRVRAPVHVAVRARRGQVLVSGIRPWTPTLVLRPGAEDGSTAQPYELIPMV